MPQIVEAYGQRLEFPDGMSQEQMAAAIRANAPKLMSAAGVNPTDDMGIKDRTLAGIGSGMSSVVRALGGGSLLEKFGLPGTKEDAEALDAPLMATTAGKVGRVIGTAAPALPTMLIPGVNTYAGAALAGAGTGAAFTDGDIGERMQGAALGGLGGVAGKGLGDALGAGSRWMGARMADGRAAQQAANVQRDAAIMAARQAGYVIPPADVRGGLLNEVLGGLSGKIKTAQVASARNQGTTNNLARQALGLADDAPLTADALQAFRNAAATKGYAPIRAAGEVTVDRTYAKALDSIAGQYQGAARSFPGAAKNPVLDMVESLKQAKFDAGDGLDMVKVLRESADKAYRSGDTGLGKASKAAAEALEDQIERHLKDSGDDAAMAAFRKARQDIAKSYSVQKAVNPGTGDVSAHSLARELAKGRPLSDELRTIAEVGSAFPKATQALKESPKAVSPLDFAFGGGASLATGNPLALATLAARPAARALQLSPLYQGLLAKPQSYSQGLLEMSLPVLESQYLGRAAPGLLAANFAQ